MSIQQRLQQLIANDSNPHSQILNGLRGLGYHYDGSKVDRGINMLKMSYKSKRTPEHNAQLINHMKKHGFTHTKIDAGHEFKKADAYASVKSKVGASRLEYRHKT